MRALVLVLAGVAMLAGCQPPAPGGVQASTINPDTPEVTKLFEQYDCDRNSLLTYEELKGAEVSTRTAGGDVKSIDHFNESAIGIYNNDENGGLDKNELAKLWKVMQGFFVFARTDGGCPK